ncbi:hypothetical protein OESDEN_03645 [Oesophagostomum dentatum]|uniref:ET module n=1 Tax=Oesophagostomum dentatum TaxID=61180 RepID=A0A0B1TGJ1_OESDE|nr:hypothetical protein OESDEN_03645 [Oesophagostomum dentatum]
MKRITAVTPVSLASYGCDQSASLCKMTECYQNQNGGKTCCCPTDLCNTSKLHLKWTSMLIAAVFFVLF